jgi:hypothetical protein
MPSRRESFNFLGLAPDEFEELVFLLAALEIPGLTRTGNPDGGLDAVVPRTDSEGVGRGMQAKHHGRGPNITKCVKSLSDAIATHNPTHVTFAFPTNLTAGQLAAFQDKVAGLDPNVEVDYWGASQLTARLIGSDGGRRIARHIFGDDEAEKLERLIRAHQNVDDGGQALEALAASSDLLDSDPRFLYAIGSQPPEIPAPPPVKGTVMRLQVTDEHGVRHIDALARPETSSDELPGGKFVLEGEEAIERWRKFQAEGGEVEFKDVSFRLENLPKHFASLWDSERGDIVIQSHERPRQRILLDVEGDAGSYSAEIQLQRVAPKKGWEHAVAGNAGAAQLTINARRQGNGGEANINWSWEPGRDSSREWMESLQFLRAASGDGKIRLMDPESKVVFTQGPTPRVAFDENTAALTQVYEDVVALEEWLETGIEVPDLIPASDANALRKIARLIEGIEGPWTNANFVLDAGGPTEVEAEGVLQVRRKMGVKLFDRTYWLGELATYVNAYQLDSTQPTEDGGTQFFLVPRDSSSKMLERLERERSVGPVAQSSA